MNRALYGFVIGFVIFLCMTKGYLPRVCFSTVLDAEYQVGLEKRQIDVTIRKNTVVTFELTVTTGASVHAYLMKTSETKKFLSGREVVCVAGTGVRRLVNQGKMDAGEYALFLYSTASSGSVVAVNIQQSMF